MFRFLFALAFLAGAAFTAPTAEAAAACYQQGNQIHCNELPAGWDCAQLQSVFDSTNSTGTSEPITMIGCTDAQVTFNGLREVSTMAIGPKGPVQDGSDQEPPTGNHVGVFMTYVQDGRFKIVEAAEGSDMGALMVLAAKAAGCGPSTLPYTVTALATDGPGRMTINGERIEIERVRITVRETRSDLYGEILISGEPIEFED